MSTLAPPHTPDPAAARRTALGIGAGLLAAVIWGGYLAVSRQGIAAGLRPVDLALLRYVAAGAALLPWVLRNQPATLAGLGWGRAIILSVLAGPPFVLIGAGGYLFAPLAHGAVVQLGTVTLASMLLAALVLSEQVSLRRLAGLCVVIAGLACIAGPAILSGGSQARIGDLMFACAGAMWAVFAVLVRRWRVAPLAATAAVSVVSALVFVPLYFLAFGTAPLAAASPWLLVEQATVQGLLSGVVALFAFASAVELLGAGQAALFPAASPAVAILIGIPLTGEVPDGGQWLGLAVVSVGLVLAVAPRFRKA